jgi:hypothetical protein
MADDMNPRGAPGGAEPDHHSRDVHTGESIDELAIALGRGVLDLLNRGERHVLVSLLDDDAHGRRRFGLNTVDAFLPMDPARPANN